MALSLKQFMDWPGVLWTMPHAKPIFLLCAAAPHFCKPANFNNSQVSSVRLFEKAWSDSHLIGLLVMLLHLEVALAVLVAFGASHDEDADWALKQSVPFNAPAKYDLYFLFIVRRRDARLRAGTWTTLRTRAASPRSGSVCMAPRSCSSTCECSTRAAN